MTVTRDSLKQLYWYASVSVIVLTHATAMAQDAPIIQPGAPGESARELTAEEAVEIANTSYSPADALFMQDMIPHHNQAVQMAALVADRTNRPELATLKSTDFDRLFLQLMIPHHEGAVKMVEELMEQPGAAYDPVLFEFTTDITNDQTAEIERMNALLVSLSDDARAVAPGKTSS